MDNRNQRRATSNGGKVVAAHTIDLLRQQRHLRFSLCNELAYLRTGRDANSERLGGVDSIENWIVCVRTRSIPWGGVCPA